MCRSAPGAGARAFATHWGPSLGGPGSQAASAVFIYLTSTCEAVLGGRIILSLNWPLCLLPTPHSSSSRKNPVKSKRLSSSPAKPFKGSHLLLNKETPNPSKSSQDPIWQAPSPL